MPQLTELQRNRLIENINSLSINQVLKYFQRGDITFDDVPLISAERRQYIEEQLAQMPNPIEQREWQEISQMASTPSQALLDRVAAYIRQWKTLRPTGNHVDEALQLHSSVQTDLTAEMERIEMADWNQVNPFSISSLIGHISRYPNTVHRSDIDKSVWNLTDKENVQDIQNYITLFPQGIHVQEARALLNSIYDWNNVRNTQDIFAIHDYIIRNPNSPFLQQARIAEMGLKQNEIESMRNYPTQYDVSRLMRLLDYGIVSDNELILNNVMTQSVIQTLRATNVAADLPDIQAAIAGCTPVCKDGYTDVFFFGVPSTGKTCVLMGLSRSDSLNINLASGGGDYAAALQQYTDVGITVPPTPGTFVTTLEATITSNENANAEHKVNLVEMSGEEFAFGIANNPDHNFTFEDMGTGATQLLSNDNRKVFFLIVDPTANVVRINREVEVNGGISIEHCIVNQRVLIQKMVNIFQDSSNADIMKKVDAIHIIMTKSDTLGNPVEREDEAYRIFQAQFGNSVLHPLVKLSKNYNINAQTNFCPKLYTFSLGSFYVGNLYEYEPNDSNRLVRAIQNSTHSHKEKSWWDKLKETVNK